MSILEKAIPAAIDAAATVGGAFLGQHFTEQNRDADQRNFERNQNASWTQQEQMAQRMPVLTKLGMQAAGLNPNMPTSLGAVPSASPAPLQTSRNNPVNMPALGSMLLDNEVKQASADKLKAETREQEIKNQHLESADSGLNDAMKSSVSRLISEYKKDGIDTKSLEDFDRYLDTNKLDFGSLRSRVESLNLERLLSTNIRYDVSDALDILINQGKIKEDVANDITHMSHTQRKLLDKQLTQAIKNISLIAAQTNEVKSQTDLNTKNTLVSESRLSTMLKEREKLDEEIKYLKSNRSHVDAMTNNIKNSDFKTQYANGDYLGVARTLGLDAINNILKLMPMLLK